MSIFEYWIFFFFFFQAEDGIRDDLVTGVQTCALPICNGGFALRGDVVASGAAAEGKAAVTSARTLGDSALVVHAHAQAAARERKRARDTGDAGADDRDVDFTLRARVDRARWLVEPEWCVHAADATRARA